MDEQDLATMFLGFTEERASQGAAMWRREGARLRRLALAPLVSAVLLVGSFALLALALPGSGSGLAIAADLVTFGGAFALIPTGFALLLVQSDRAVSLARRTTVFGVIAASLLCSAALAALASDLKLLSYTEPRPGAGPFGLYLIGAALLGLWLFVAGCPGRSNWVLSRWWTWTGVIAGAGLLATAISFAALGDAHPLTLGTGLAAIAMLPTWLVWLAIILIRGERGWRTATGPLLDQPGQPAGSAGPGPSP